MAGLRQRCKLVAGDRYGFGPIGHRFKVKRLCKAASTCRKKPDSDQWPLGSVWWNGDKPSLYGFVNAAPSFGSLDRNSVTIWWQNVAEGPNMSDPIVGQRIIRVELD